MKQKSCNKLYSWLILIGLSIQSFSPLVAVIHSQDIQNVALAKKGITGESIVVRSNKDLNVNNALQETISLHDFDVAQLIIRVVEQAVEENLQEELSESLVQCYRSVVEEDGIVDVDTVIQAMPELLEYAVEEEQLALDGDRAVRPNAPTIADGNAIVSCGGDCDLTQLIRLLSSIRARIGSVKDSPCCGTILGILGDACNVPCIGENSSISEVLCEILNSVTQLNFTGTVEVDLNGVFTALEYICEKQEGTFTVLNNIEFDLDGVFTVLDNLDLNVTATVEVDLNGIFTALDYICEKIEGTFTVLDECCACNPIPLFQSDVDGDDEIKLSIDGQNYCLAENIIGTIVITGANVTVDGNDRVVTGRFVIDNEDIIVKNAKVKPEAPTTNDEALNEPGIEVTLAGSRARILNCSVECEGTVLVLVNGRNAINVSGEEVVIEGCSIKGGNGGDGTSGSNGGIGGSGIRLLGDNSSIIKSRVIGGNGGNGVDDTSGGNGGAGGNGVTLDNSDNHLVIDSEFIGGNGGTGGMGSSTTGGNGGSGGSPLRCFDASHVVVQRCQINPGNGGDAGTGVGSDGNGGNGGNGIRLIGNTSDVIIKECCILDGGNGGNSVGGTGGNGFDGILVSINESNVQICGCKINNVGAAGTGSVAGTPGNGIGIFFGATCVQVVSNRVACCEGIGINNEAGTESTLYNNIATDNAGGNYSGVPFVRTPGPQTGFYVNVTDGPEDCDLCGIYTVLDEGFGCNPVPLFQSDVDVDGEIKLTETGINYCLAENITGTIVISGANVTVDGNDRVVTGRFVIDNEDIIVKNAKVKPGAPITNDEAFLESGIEVTLTGSKAQIINCLVECEDNVVSVDGRNAINVFGEEVVIKDCIAKAGDAGPTRFGGVGILFLGLNITIINSTVIGGNGGNGTTGAGQAAGDGIEMFGDNCSIIKSRVIGGNGGNGADNTSGGNGANGARGVTFADGENYLVIDSEIIGGNGGTGGMGSSTTGGNGGIGAEALELSGVSHAVVQRCQITPGNGGDGGTGVTTDGDGGSGGRGINLENPFGNSDVIIKECCILDGGNGGNSGNNGGNGSDGIRVLGSSSNIQICGCKINNVGAAGTGNVAGTPGNGIRILNGATCVQLVNNSVTCCEGIGINNEAGTESTFYVNFSTGNGIANYRGVPNGVECYPIPLFQHNVDSSGEITLTETGINYCLAENITGTIVITGANVTVDGNDRVVTGRVEIRNEEIIVKDMKVKPEAPLDNTQAAQAAIEVFGASSTNVQIVNCFVECSGTVVAVGAGVVGVNGRSGVVSAAAETLVENCVVNAGSGGTGGDNAVALAGAGGVGGDGIELNGDNAIVRGSIATAGSGGNGGNGTAGQTGGAGGVGGVAIASNGMDNLVVGSQALGGFGGNGGTSNDLGGAGGAGGTAIQSTSSNITIIESQVFGGSGSIGGNGDSFGGAGGNGASGITLNDNVASLVDVRIVAGDGGNGGNGTSDDGGAGGNGGSALEVFGDNVTVKGSRITPGNGGTPGTGGVIDGAGGNGGNGILISGSTIVMVKECCILDGADGGFSAETIGENGDGISIVSTSSDVQICDCKINNLGAILSNVTGAGIYIDNTSESVQIVRTDILAHADNGILIEGDCITILDCLLVENGGVGLRFEGASNCQITNCVSECNTDNGFSIDNSSSNIEIVNGSAIGNTGLLGGFFIDGDNCIFKNCTAIQNVGSGFNILTNNVNNMFIDCNSSTNTSRGFVIAGDDCTFKNCNAVGNVQDGFEVSSAAENVSLIACDAYSNVVHGFEIDGVDCLVENCNASGNGTDGFQVGVTASSCSVISCRSTSNGDNGFDIVPVAGITLLNNYAENNTVLNYDGTISPIAPVNPPTAATGYWANVEG